MCVCVCRKCNTVKLITTVELDMEWLESTHGYVPQHTTYHWPFALAPLRELFFTPIQDSTWNNQNSSLICFSQNRETLSPSSWIHIYPSRETETRWNDPLIASPSSHWRYMDYIYLRHSQRLFKFTSPPRAHSEMHLDIQFAIPWSYIFLPISQKEEMFEEKEWKCTVWMVAFSICHRGIMQGKEVVPRRLVYGQNLTKMHQFKFPMFALAL